MKALVIGGTGATGPYVVEGLLARGYEVTILHSGQHEVDFSGPVEHLHGDPYFKETLEETIGDREYDVAVAMYGRLRIAADVLRSRTNRVVGVGGSGGYALANDPRWGPLGRPLLPNESGVWQDEEGDDKFTYLMYMSEEKLFDGHRDGAYNATMIRPPNMYGPGQLAPEEWCIIRRILDGRKRMIVADGGLKIEARVYVANAAEAVLVAIDKPNESAGRRFNVHDAALYTMRQRIELVARTMGAELELVNMPFELARPSRVLWRNRQAHMATDDSLIRNQLGHKDVLPAEEAIPSTVKWLLEHRPEPGGEAEQQLGDPFNYEAEDAVIAAWERARETVAAVPYDLPTPAHRYRHPKKPGEIWQRPAESSYAQRAGKA